MKNWILSLFDKAPISYYERKSLQQAQIELHRHQAMADYAESQVAMYQKRIDRLTSKTTTSLIRVA